MFECAEALLKAADGGVACARVGVAVFGVGEVVGAGAGVGLHKAAGEVQGFAVFVVLAAGQGLAYGLGVGVPVGVVGAVGGVHTAGLVWLVYLANAGGVCQILLFGCCLAAA